MLKLHYIHQTPSHAKTSLHLPNTLTCQNVNTSTKSPYMPKPQPVYHTSYTQRRQSVYPLTHKTSCSPSLIISIPSGLTCRFSLPTKPNRIAKTSVCLPCYTQISCSPGCIPLQALPAKLESLLNGVWQVLMQSLGQERSQQPSHQRERSEHQQGEGLPQVSAHF